MLGVVAGAGADPVEFVVGVFDLAPPQALGRGWLDVGF